jgi:hypothetical protein
MRSAPTRARLVSEAPIDLDKHRGMAARKATDIRGVIAEVEANAKLLRDRQGASSRPCGGGAGRARQACRVGLGKSAGTAERSNPARSGTVEGLN